MQPVQRGLRPCQHNEDGEGAYYAYQGLKGPRFECLRCQCGRNSELNLRELTESTGRMMNSYRLMKQYTITAAPIFTETAVNNIKTN